MNPRARDVDTLLIDPFAGASGDMLLCALIDAGAPLDVLRVELGKIRVLENMTMDTREVQRGAFRARQLDPRPLPSHDHVHRGLSDVLDVIDSAQHIDGHVRDNARAVFTRLATVEARLHGTTVDEVHFHELGAHDAIMDIVGFFLATSLLGITAYRYTRLLLGQGTAHSAHGDIPVPVPATLELLKGHAVYFGGRVGEQITPTAAALISTVFQPLDSSESIIPRAFGYGAGTREDSSGLPGVLRVVVGQRTEKRRLLTVIRCTVDDMTPEVTGHATQKLFGAGALEVYVTPIAMKKNRPGVEITLLCENCDADRLARAMLTETTTIGVRIAREERIELERRAEQLSTPLGNVCVKVVCLPDGSLRMSPEYESCRELADAIGRPIEAIYRAAHAAWAAHESGAGS